MTASLTRREFLGTSAGAVAALASGPLLAQSPPPSEQIVVGVMGLGRGLRVARTFSELPGVTIKYICDVDEKRASLARAHFEKGSGQTPEPINDFRRILDDRDVDILVCAAPNHWHAPATIMACNAGKHVYVEKPCCHNPWEGETMVEAARKHDRAVQMGTQRRSNDGFLDLMPKLHEGIIGKIYCSRAWYNNLRGTIGHGKQVDVPPGLDFELWQGPATRKPYQDNLVHYNWHWFWHWGNGELGNNGVHTLDICRWGLQVDHPTSVISSGGRYRYDDDQETPDTQVATYEFEGGKQITWQGLSCNRHRDSKSFVSFYGEKGSCEVEADGNYRIYDANDKIIDQYKPEGKPKYRSMEHAHAANLLDAIRNNKHLELNSEIDIGNKSTLLCHLGNIAYRVQRQLKCDAQNGHIIDDAEAMEYWKRSYEPGWEPHA